MLKPRPTYPTWRAHRESTFGEKCHEERPQYFENCKS